MHETQRALQAIVDATVLGFHLDESAAELDLVCAQEGTVPGARALVRFRFYGVRHFERTPGRDRELREVGSTFVARDVRGTWLVQTVRREKPGHLRVVALSMGEAFAWDYFEVGTDRPVDVHNPFGCSWAEATRR